MIQKVFKKIEKEIELHTRKSSTKKLLSKTYDDTDTQTFFNIIQQLQNKKWTENEKKYLDRIQSIRHQYASSNTKVNIVDYGAGTPEKDLSQNQMEQGTETQLKVSDIYKIASTTEKFGELMFGIIRSFQPAFCLELGTSLGISAAYQISALALNGVGHLSTIEGSPEIAKIAKQTLSQFNYPSFNIHTGKFTDVLPKIFIENTSLDLVFIDGHHEKKATLTYYHQIYPYLNKKSIVIFDDINWSKGMQEIWKEISTKEKGIKTIFDMYYWGICIIDKEYKSDRKFYKIGL